MLPLNREITKYVSIYLAAEIMHLILGRYFDFLITSINHRKYQFDTTKLLNNSIK